MFWQRKSNCARKHATNNARRRTLQMETLETRAVPAVFMVTNVNDSGDGSLRAAITSANSAVGKDTINFNIPGNVLHTIRPVTQLPDVADTVAINGSGVIELSGADSNIPWGLNVTSNASLIQGVIINGFRSGSLRVTGNVNTIANNSLGASAAGDSVPVRASVASLFLEAGASTNLITSNYIVGGDSGILLNGSGTSKNSVMDNSVGARGGVGLGNGTGIVLSNSASGNTFVRNTVQGNEHAGISLIGSASAANRLDFNLIYGNGGLAIDLGADGPTKNDYLDSDVGPNQFTNAPVIRSVVDRNGLLVTGTLHSVPNQSFEIVLSSSQFADAAGRGESEFLITPSRGVFVRTDSNGDASFSATVIGSSSALVKDKIIHDGWVVSATATNQYNNTSEFSAAFSFNNGGVNQPPVIGQGNTPVTYVAGALPVLVAPAGGVIDRDTPNYGGGYLSIKTLENAEGTDRLGIRSTGTGAGQISTSGIQVQYGGVTIGTFSGGAGSSALVIALNKNATPAAAQALLRAITFQSLSATPTAGKRTLQFQLGDGHGQLSNNAFSFVNVM